MMVFKNKASVTFLMVLAMASSSLAYARNNLATVIIDNKTLGSATFTHEQMSGAADPAMSDVGGGRTASYKVTSFADSISGMRFVYTSGTKQCRFSVSHTAPAPRHVPTWKKDARSIGSARATCLVNIERIDPNMPYDYTVRFTIQ